MPPATLPKALRVAVERLGKADLMVGIPSFKNAATIGYVARAAQAGLVQYFPDLRPVLANADAGSPDGTQRVVVETEPPDYIERILLVRPRNRLQRISLTYPPVDGVGGKGAALLTIFRIAHALDVDALVVVDSDLRSIVPEWIELLAGPILKGGFDFVAPLYSRYKWDGTITNTVTYPLTRALYGLRIRQPIGGDFGVSGDLIAHYLAQDDWTPDVSRFGIDIWMTTTAIAGGFAVCQTRLGAKVHDPKDPGADLGPMFSQVVSHVPAPDRPSTPSGGCRCRGRTTCPPTASSASSTRLPCRSTCGACSTSSGAAATPWARRGRRRSTPRRWPWWSSSPTHAGELAARLPTGDPATAPAEFAFPDETWARVIYDVVLASRDPAVALDRLVAALVPDLLRPRGQPRARDARPDDR